VQPRLLDVEALENDLSLLAHQKSGFERPEALMAGLQVLLSLKAVVQVAGAMQDSRAARVAALRTVLRQVVDRIASESTRRTVSIYFFLLTEDELEALGLNRTLTQASLGERRQAIADLLHSTPAAFRNGDEHRVCALVAGELLCYETEISRIIDEPGLSPEPTSKDRPVSTTARGATQAVRRAISHLYRDDQRLLPLASLLVPDRVIYYDAAVDLTLVDSDNDSDRYIYRLSLTFTAELTEYVVGYVCRSHLTDTLLVGSKLVTDVYSFSTERARDECVKRFSGSLDVVTLVTARSDGRTVNKGLRMEAVPKNEYKTYLGDEYDKHGRDIKLLRADLPASRSPARLKVVQEFGLDKSDHFCYWVADRPIFLRQLRVDTRQFTPPGSGRGWRVTLQPFMMATNAELALHLDGAMSEETDNWLIRGQGFAVVW
jgi:hypothetical protein